MKIALVCPASLPATQFGGIMFLCIHIANRLTQNGHQVTIYTTDLDFANNLKTINKNLPKEEYINQFIGMSETELNKLKTKLYGHEIRE